MKRVLLIGILASLVSFGSWAQVCTPDNTITSPGVYPEQPDTAYADLEYDFSFQVLALKDTVVSFAGQTLNATIDSVKVNGVIGLPDGFTYMCNPTNCVFTWRAVGCVNVKGNPTQSQAGSYDLKIATTAYGRSGILALPVPDTTDGYVLVIQGDGSASIFEPKEERILLYPNPSTDGKFILKTAKETEVIKIIDLQGKLVDYKEVNTKDAVSIDLSETPKGVYIITVSVGERIYTKKVVH